MMTIRSMAAIMVLAGMALANAAAAWAAADDYRFELAGPPAKTGNGLVVKVWLLHTPDNKPVPGAVIFQTRLDMGPDGMASMTAPAKAVPDATEPGVYAFQIEPSMAGRWALTLAAKVQGEAETVRGSVTFPVPK